MAHELHIRNGKASMAYVGSTPWHKLGQKIEAGATIDQIRQAAGYDFSIERAEASYIDVNGKVHAIPGFSALHRSDDGAFISLRSETRFKVVQPAEILEFYRDLIDATDGEYDFETAGVLYGGKKLWCLARANDQADVGKNDTILPYLLLTTANDGTMATTGKLTSVRVVCDNTLRMSLGANIEGEVRVPHSRQFDPNKVKMELGIVHDALKEFKAFGDELARVRLSDEQALDYFMRLYGPEPTVELNVEIPDFNEENYGARRMNKVKALVDAYENGPGSDMKEASGTLWGALNAVTYYQDHKATTRATGGRSSDETRLASSQFGQGATFKRHAVELAVEYLK